MKKILFIMSLAFLSQFVLVPSSQASLLEFFFPSLRTLEEDPTDTLQAPFADPVLQAQRPIAEGQLPENAIPLEQPHRVDESIRDWLVTVSSEVMSFSGANLETDFTDDKAYFTQSGWTDYQGFLEEKGILNALKSGRHQLRSFVEEVPLLLNEGPVNGRYRWLYEVPMMVSYLDRDVRDYKGVQPVNQMIVLTIQVGRSATVESPEGILIEHWSGKVKETRK